jgi:hypothetical protein
MINPKAFRDHIAHAEKALERANQHVKVAESLDIRALIDNRLDLASNLMVHVRNHVRMARVCKEV